MLRHNIPTKTPHHQNIITDGQREHQRPDNEQCSLCHHMPTNCDVAPLDDIVNALQSTSLTRRHSF